MSKYKTGTAVRHSRHGDGTVTSIRTETETPPAFDALALRREELNLRARLAEIAATIERGTDPRPVDVYEVTFSNGRKLEFKELGVDKLAARALEPAAAS